MASNYPHEKPMLDPETFNAIEITIRKSINSMMQKLIERRDQLIQQLQEIRENFLYEEERRIEDLKYLDERIRKKEEENIELHSKTNERMIEEWKLQKEQKNHPNPIPLPHFGVHHLDELRNQIEKFGALRDPTLNPKGKTV